MSEGFDGSEPATAIKLPYCFDQNNYLVPCSEVPYRVTVSSVMPITQFKSAASVPRRVHAGPIDEQMFGAK
jgi:hypothetical protein